MDPTASMKGVREGQTTTLLANGQVLVAGGIDGSTTLAGAELYNPATGKWTVTGSLNTACADQTARLLPDGQVLVAGGFTEPAPGALSYLSSAELYNPATGKWTVTGGMSSPAGPQCDAAAGRPGAGGRRRGHRERFPSRFSPAPNCTTRPPAPGHEPAV